MKLALVFTLGVKPGSEGPGNLNRSDHVMPAGLGVVAQTENHCYWIGLRMRPWRMFPEVNSMTPRPHRVRQRITHAKVTVHAPTWVSRMSMVVFHTEVCVCHHGG